MEPYMKFGWRPHYPGIERCLCASKHPIFSVAFSDRDFVPRDTFLYKYLLWIRPNYTRGNQLIGSCVGWATELGCTILLAKNAYRSGDTDVFKAEASTEAAYSLSRVEARGFPGDGARPYGGYQDGSYCSAAAKGTRDFGVLLRLDYSGITGQSDDDLRVYSGQKEKDWGAYGCGGKNDQERMDKLAKEHPIKEYSQCRDFDDVAKAISGLRVPVIVGSSQGFEGMSLDSDGFWKPRGSWMHAMCFIGVRFGARPGALIAQSWGPNTTQRVENRWPKSMPLNIAGFTGWVDADIVTKMCKQDDALALVESTFKTDDLDFSL